MKILFLSIWFLVFIEHNHTKQSYMTKDVKIVDSLMIKHCIPYSSDSLLRLSFIEVRTSEVYFYVEKKNKR